MRDENIRSAELAELRPHHLEVRCVCNVTLRDPVRTERAGSDGHTRLDARVKLIDDPAVSNSHRGDLYYLGAIDILVGRLDVDGREIAERIGESSRADELRGLEEPETQAERWKVCAGDA